MATPQEMNTINKIEQRLGPVGKGHHNSHRTAALLKWLKAKEAQKGSGKSAPTGKAADKLTPGDNVDAQGNPTPQNGKHPIPPQFLKHIQNQSSSAPQKGKNPIPPQFLKGK